MKNLVPGLFRNRVKRLRKIRKDIVNMLAADRQTDGAGRDILLGKLLVVQLTMRGRSGVDDETLHIRHIRKQREHLQAVAEFLRRLPAALHLDGEDGRAAVRKITLIERMIRMIDQGRMVDLIYLRMTVKELDHLCRVECVALKAQGQRFKTLQQQEAVERGNARAGIAKQHAADIGGIRGVAVYAGEGHAVIAGVRLADLREAAAGRPVELTGIDNHAAEGRAVTADKLRGGMDDDIRAVLDGADEIRRAEGIVDHQRQTVAVRNLCNRIDIRNIAVGKD